ncbi:MAG: hypothetical protein ABGZ53_24240 [Fuerstiella sp.]
MSAEDEFNPYSRPLTSDSAEYVSGTRTPSPFAVLLVVIASIIAAGGAFFCSCLGLVVADLNGPGTGLEVGGMIFGCGLFALLAYILTAKLGLAFVAGLMSSTQAAPVRRTSWAVLFLSACAATTVFVCCFLVIGGVVAACAGITAGTIVIWKVPGLMAAWQERAGQPDEAADSSTDFPQSFGGLKHGD